ncbi:MAG: MFS transporter [Anaerolineales bacterium]|nr:MFS transporter [Anaerolineales bacterium]
MDPTADAGAISPTLYRRRIFAWTMYDWANSAFATTILAAILPIYYSQVAGATLPTSAMATAYWGAGLSISLLIAAVLAPILGTVSDISRSKKRFLALFVAIGVIGTGLLVLVQAGDWLMASLLFILAKVGFNAANVFYDALLPHVARPEDRDRVSTRGYAMGYLGGGILLAINVVMIQMLPGTWGPRLSFLSVGAWWAVFSLPIFRWVPEPPAATAALAPGGAVLSASFRRLAATLGDIRQYRELFKFLLAFLIYNDGIGTIIGVAAIYGAELGFGAIELVLALLLVQFVGIPFSLIFGRLPDPNERRRAFYLAFVLFNLVALPVTGLAASRLLSPTASGAPQPAFPGGPGHAGQGVHFADSPYLDYLGPWEPVMVAAETIGQESDLAYQASSAAGAEVAFHFEGQRLALIYATGPDAGVWTVDLDGAPLFDPDTGDRTTINAYARTPRYDASARYEAESPGEHLLVLRNTGERDPLSQGTSISLVSIQVQPPGRQSSLPLILGMILAVEAVGLALAYLLKGLVRPLAERLTTKSSILLALGVYTVIAAWGFRLDSVVEFWFLAWMVAVVQGGSQALSRSLYASLSPAAKSGEFFGLFGVMEKFSAILGPLIFAAVAASSGSSRPAVLSIVAFFLVGGFLLSRVDIGEGRRRAAAEDVALLGAHDLAGPQA